MIVFLTGGSRGIGKHIKKVFLNKGWEVISPTSSELDLGDVESVIKYTSKANFVPDVIINNAGTNTVENVIDFSRDTFMRMMDINFISHVMLTKEFLKKSKCNNKRLSVINIGSIRIQEMKKGRIHYTISKACLDIFTKYLIHEMGDERLRCNTISPGYVATDMLTRNNDQDKLKDMMNSVPLERFCNPIEIAEAAFHIAVENTYLNGQNIVIDGGKSCR